MMRGMWHDTQRSLPSVRGAYGVGPIAQGRVSLHEHRVGILSNFSEFDSAPRSADEDRGTIRMLRPPYGSTQSG